MLKPVVTVPVFAVHGRLDGARSKGLATESWLDGVLAQARIAGRRAGGAWIDRLEKGRAVWREYQSGLAASDQMPLRPERLMAALARAPGRDPAALAGRLTLGHAAATTAGNAAETAAWIAAQ
jgi:hypothetical protein